MTDTAFVEFERVQKSYDGETLVVKDLNLSLPKGEFLTMLGPSGSGKTTCLMMLAGFETATHGEIRLAGKPINNIPPHKRGIGMVFQNYALFPHMTVAENLSFPLEVRKIGKSERETLQFEITHLAHELGITVVYVTHDQTEALTMSDRVAVFDDGRIQQLAAPDELY